MLLSLISLSLASPPEQAEAKGLEKNCEAITDADDAAEVVLDDAEAALQSVADTAGTPWSGEIRVNQTVMGRVVVGDCSDDATLTYCVATSGPVSVSFAGKTTDFDNPAQFTLSTDGAVSYSLTPIGDDGSVGETTTYTSKAGFETLEGTVVIDDGGDVGTIIWPKYGDIIIGSMPLDNFYD